MKDILERIEELLSLQEKLINLLLLSGYHRGRLSAGTALDILYYNIELLDLIEELLNSPDALSEDYPVNLALEALSWMSFVLPRVEEFCPVFLHSITEREKDPMQRLRSVIFLLEEARRKADYYTLLDVLEEVSKISGLLRYHVILARRAYINLT